MSTAVNNADFQKWFADITAKRVENCGTSVSDFAFAPCRVRLVNGKSKFTPLSKKDLDSAPGKTDGGCVVYWMNRDQRVQGKPN